MRTPSPGNRVLIGDSGVEFEVNEHVASGLVNSHKADYADGLPAPGKRIGRSKRAAAARAEAEAAAAEGQKVDLEELSVAKLKELAAERDINLGDAKSKAEIIDVIADALDADNDE